MKWYIVYVDGVATEYIQAGNHNSAEKKARKKWAGYNVLVVYTEI